LKHQVEIIITMKSTTNYKLLAVLIVLSTCFTATSSEAQIWKRLKKKAKEKLKKTEDKLVNKLDKKTDKVLDSTIDGTGKTKKKGVKTTKQGNVKNKRDAVVFDDKTYGSASLNHSAKYGVVNIKTVHKTKVQKEGQLFRMTGNWITTGVDVFDGYYIELKSTNLEELKTKKTFNIPTEATVRLGYDPIDRSTHQRESSGEGQSYDVESGILNVTFVKDQTVEISFSGNATLKKAVKKANPSYEDEYEYIETPTTISGSINTSEPEYSIVKSNGTKSGSNTGSSTSNADVVTNRRNPTTTIPGSFSFNKKLNVEVIDHRGDSYPVDILLGNYSDIYGMQMAVKEMQGQGNVTIVNTPKNSTMFMDVGGMKMKKTTKLAEMGDQYQMSDQLPDGADFSYKKTGNTKTIAGYSCEEYKVEYNYTNNQGSASLWISKDFPIQNMQLPMLGMTLNNPYYSGFVMELNMTTNGKTTTMRVTGVSNTSLRINSSEFRKMGF